MFAALTCHTSPALQHSDSTLEPPVSKGMQQCDLHYVQSVLIHEININTTPTITNTVTTTTPIIIILLSIVSVLIVISQAKLL
jgi:cell division protein FtsX